VEVVEWIMNTDLMPSVDNEVDLSETIEDLGREGFRLIQKKSGFRYGEDTVLLAHFAAQLSSRKRRMLKVAELGTNCGAASILLAARRNDILIDGVEVQPEAARVFVRNITINHLEDRIKSYCCDIRHLSTDGPEQMKRASYDMVFFNPPYYVPGRGLEPSGAIASRERLEARSEVCGTTQDFIHAADWLLLPQGQVILVQRASRLPDVLFHMKQCHIEPSRIRFVHVRPDKPATLFLLSAQKHRKPGGFQVMPPLILYKEEHTYSDELHSIYVDGGS